jgi:TonB family protein
MGMGALARPSRAQLGLFSGASPFPTTGIQLCCVPQISCKTNRTEHGLVTQVTFAAFGILSSLAAVNKSPMRPYFAAVFIALSLGAIAFSPTFSLAQEQSEATRKIVSRVVPVYPELANKMRIRGTVKVEAVVAPNGKVKFTQVIGGSPLLARAAVDAIEKWKWGPAPQETKELIELNFHP